MRVGGHILSSIQSGLDLVHARSVSLIMSPAKILPFEEPANSLYLAMVEAMEEAGDQLAGGRIAEATRLCGQVQTLGAAIAIMREREA